ncbi:hypothetical protein NECAME_01627 [Necator americanus]|uniref:Uncharacterized protein n=1 Tax=Necator americanus TaxID=51031 RepID=W2TTM5_NECAM|nr:hypothetical protein NECAME_01627 [Necator americanus]ETN84402.1 hypothetical protein NECAME_01627 [Necator americanus]
MEIPGISQQKIASIRQCKKKPGPADVGDSGRRRVVMVGMRHAGVGGPRVRQPVRPVRRRHWCTCGADRKWIV